MDELELTRGEQTRQEILDAAKGLFLAQGYTATSMRQVARAVGITPAAIYNHFPGKDEIFTSLLQQEAPYDELFALTDGMQDDTPEGLLGQMLRGAIELVAEHQDYLRLAMIDAQEREGATLAGFLPQILPRAQELYQRLVALDAGQGHLREIPFLVFTRTLVSLILGFSMTEQMAKAAPMIKAAATDWPQVLADVFMFGVLDRNDAEGG